MVPLRFPSVATGTAIIRVVTNTRHPFAIPLEPVADGLAQNCGTRRLFAMLAPILGVLIIAPQRLPAPAHGRGQTAHLANDQVFAMPPRQRVRHTQPQDQRAVIGNSSHAELATRRLIPAPQHEELVTAGIPPVPQPFLMAGVAIGLQVVLLAPQPPGPEAQPHPALSYVAFQCSQPDSQIGQPTPLLMNLIPSATFSGIEKPAAQPPGNAPPQSRPARIFCCSLTDNTLPLQRHPYRR